MHCLLLHDSGDLTLCHSSGQARWQTNNPELSVLTNTFNSKVPHRLGLWRASGPLARTLEVAPAISELVLKIMSWMFWIVLMSSSANTLNQHLIQSEWRRRLVCPTTQCHSQVLEICHTTNPGVNRYQFCVKTLGSWSCADWSRSPTCLTREKNYLQTIWRPFSSVVWTSKWQNASHFRGVVLSISR